MQKLFNKVLVPVDFSEKSRKAVEKSLELAAEYQCSVHLLYVNRSCLTGPLESESPKSHEMACMGELEQLKNFVKTDPAIKIVYAVASGSWNESIMAYIEQNHIDLVMIGQENNFFRRKEMRLNPNRIASKTNIPVITIPANKRISKLCSIVIPVTDFLPVRKLIYGIYMGSKYSTTVKLLGVENEQTRAKVHYYLKKAYHLIRDNCALNVELEVVPGNNVAEAINEYAMISSADLVIVNPGCQSRMPGIFASLFGNIIQKYSVPPVLTVNPD